MKEKTGTTRMAESPRFGAALVALFVLLRRKR